MNTIVVNLIGGPGTGKSVLCASLFAQLKIQGINCEMATEYVKDLVWEESFKKISNQLYILGKQHNRLFHLNHKVQIIITDSPLLNSIVYYTGHNPHFKDLVLWEFNQMNNINYYFTRKFEYHQEGRYQDEAGAHEKDRQFHELLSLNDIPFQEITPGIDSVDFLVEDILKRLENE